MNIQEEEALTESAIKLDGQSLQVLRASAKKWFVTACVLILGCFVVVPLIGFKKEAYYTLAALAGALVPVAFQAGRLAGRVEAIDRMREISRR